LNETEGSRKDKREEGAPREGESLGATLQTVINDMKDNEANSFFLRQQIAAAWH